MHQRVRYSAKIGEYAMHNRPVNTTRIKYGWPLLFLTYFTLQILLRTIIGRGLGIDEAELMLTAQTLKWGYGAQPPLYSWIQHGIFALFGETIFSLSLLKNSFLCLTYFALYRTLRSDYDRETAGLATLSLLLLPQIGWESQRALSHSILATTLASITLLLFSRLVVTRHLWLYFLFGVAVALGTLSKFNYIVLPIAMVIAATSLRSTRGAILNPRILLSVVTTSIVLFMPLQWIITHKSMVLQSVHKFGIQGDTTGLKVALTGFFRLTEASFLFLALLIMVLLLLFFRYGNKAVIPQQDTQFFQLLLRTIMVALILILITVLWSGTTNVKDRWLQPVLFFAAPAMTLWVLPKLSALGRRRLMQLIGIVALSIFIAQPIHDIRPSRRSTPFPAIVSAIGEKYPETKIIFAKNKWIGGNLHYLKQGWAVTIPKGDPEILKGQVVLVWPSRQVNIPRDMTNYLAVQDKEIISFDPTTTVKVPFLTESAPRFMLNFTAVQLK